MKSLHLPRLAPVLFLAFLLLAVALPALAKRPVPPTPTKPVINSFSATPKTISLGQSSTLAWSVTGATKLTISPNIGVVYKSSKVVFPTTTTIYTLSAINSTGITTATTSVTVLLPIPAPTCTLSANPTSIQVGSSTTLTFSSTNAVSGSINQGVGTVATSGTKLVSPATTTTYTATFTGTGGTGTCAALVTVIQPPPPPPPPPPPSDEIFISAYTTSYSYWDNTPPGSAIIAYPKSAGYPTVHNLAGGIGTYADPITIAVGHSITNNISTPDYPPGTKFYIPNVRRYFIVEDVCGDGALPQNGPCHTGYPAGTTAWVDMWIDGQSGTEAAVHACAAFLTDTNGVAHTIIRNPSNNYVVVPGPIFQNGTCTAQFGNTPVVN